MQIDNGVETYEGGKVAKRINSWTEAKVKKYIKERGREELSFYQLG